MGICEGNFNKPFHEVRSCNPSTQGAEFKTRLVYTVNLRPVWDKQDFASTPLTLTLPSPIKSHKKKKLCHNRTKERTKWRNKREPSDKNFSRKKFNCTPIKSRAHMAKSLLKKEKKKKRETRKQRSGEILYHRAQEKQQAMQHCADATGSGDIYYLPTVCPALENGSDNYR